MANSKNDLPCDPFFLRLRALLRERDPRLLALPGFKLSAVLLLLWMADDEPLILLTRRSDRVTHHPLEISFPGGRWDPRDGDLAQTALREVHEEVGIPPEEPTLLGRLDDSFSFSGYAIAPYVASVPASPSFHANEEVAELLPTRLARFHPDRFSMEEKPFHGQRVPVYTCEVDGRVIWGATARILKGFVDMISTDPNLVRFLIPEDPPWAEGIRR
jgi:8-oxo-dGTP pyrophosphatase MutT (NUDIX family)